jgi:hypothetical protein
MSEQEIDDPWRRAERLRRQIERHNRFYTIRGRQKVGVATAMQGIVQLR